MHENAAATFVYPNGGPVKRSANVLRIQLSDLALKNPKILTGEAASLIQSGTRNISSCDSVLYFMQIGTVES